MVDTTEEGLEEMEALEAIFVDDFELLPPDPRFKHRYSVTLVPHPGNDAENHACVKLVVGLGPAYPTRPAYIRVEGVRGLSDDDIESLQGIVVQQTQALVGQVMVFVVTDVVTEFLRSKNQPHGMSFFEEMQMNKLEAKAQAERDAAEEQEVSKEETQLSEIISKHGIGLNWVEDAEVEAKRKEERQKERNRKKRERQKRRKAAHKGDDGAEGGDGGDKTDAADKQRKTGKSKSKDRSATDGSQPRFTPHELILASLMRHSRVYGEVSMSRQVVRDLGGASPGVLELLANDELFEASFQQADVLQAARDMLSAPVHPLAGNAEAGTPALPSPGPGGAAAAAFAENTTPMMGARAKPELEEVGTILGDGRRSDTITDSTTLPAHHRLMQPPSRPATPGLSTSRYVTDFSELGILGRGGFGRVVKVVNKLDNRVYAVKKIPSLDGEGNMNRRLLREVHALSRLHHKNVVRYYQAWLEGASDPKKTDAKDMEVKNSSTMEGDWGLEPSWTENSVGGGMLHSDSLFRSVFDGPSERLRLASSSKTRDQMDESSSDEGVTTREVSQNGCLYIQMEYCPNTLRSLLKDSAEDLEDEDLWRLFRQIVEGLVHIHSNQIIHRDLKPNNIFLDSCNDIKIGDLGLATDGNQDGTGTIPPVPYGSGSGTTLEGTPSLPAAIIGTPDSDNDDDDESKSKSLPFTTVVGVKGGRAVTVVERTPDTSDDESSHTPPDQFDSDEDYDTEYSTDEEQERTAGVGTYFYTSPEQHQGYYDERVDMYALGVIFFEMWYVFGSAHERVVVLTKLRSKMEFPPGFADLHPRQTAIIRWLMQEDPSKRPTATELLRSDLIPPKLEEEYLKDVLRFLRDPNALTTHPEVLGSLFGQQQIARNGPNPSGYGTARVPIQALMGEQATDIIRAVFKRHGGVPIGSDLLQLKSSCAGIPGVASPESRVSVMDREGTLYDLRFNSRVAFAQLLARRAGGIGHETAVRAYDVCSVFLANAKHRRGHTQCDFDIVYNPAAGVPSMLPEAEVIRVMSEVIDEFYPQGCSSIRVGHVALVEALLLSARVPPQATEKVTSALATAFRVPYAHLSKNLKAIPELPSTSVDDLLSFSLIKGPKQEVLERLKVVVSRYPGALAALAELDELTKYLAYLGVDNIIIDPTLTPFESWYKGLLFQGVVREDKRALDIVALGGRYETLLRDFRRDAFDETATATSTTGTIPESTHEHAVGLSIALDKIVDYTRRTCHVPDSASVTDVLVCSVGAPFLQERIELTEWLWNEGINAEYMLKTNPSMEEQIEYASSIGVAAMVIMNKTSIERKTVKIRFLEGEKRQDVELSRSEAVAYLSASSRSAARNKASVMFGRAERKDKAQ